MQEIKDIIDEEAPTKTLENNKGETEPNPKFIEWEEHDVLVRSWLSGTMTEESMFIIIGC